MFPNPIVQFFSQFYAVKQFVPCDDETVISTFEMRALNIDPNDCQIPSDFTEIKQQILMGSHIFVRTAIDQILMNQDASTSDFTKLNLKFFASTLFALLLRYFSLELPKDSPFDNPPSMTNTDPETDARFNMLDGYPLTVEAMTLKVGTAQTAMA
jgi:hypothetical protein